MINTINRKAVIVNIGGVSNQTRGLFAGGGDNPALIDVIDFVTIATRGNAIDFGDRTVSGWGTGSTGNSTRGLFFGANPSKSDVIDFITIATTGNATDFGNLSNGNGYADGDPWQLSDWNGALNGGHYNVIYIEMSASW